MKKQQKAAAHTEKKFHDEEAAREYLESIRWPRGAECPHCGGTERNSRIEANPAKKVRPGLWFCGDCRQQFTVTVGTVFADSKLPLHKWVYATHLLCTSKKGFSSKQLERVLAVSYKTAWFMSHRIREAMAPGGSGLLGGGGKLGGNESTVEADETYMGPDASKKLGVASKRRDRVFSLVERKGQVRSFHVADVTAKNLKQKIRDNVARKTNIMTDEAYSYRGLSKEFLSHDTVTHSRQEYVRDEAHTNTVEGYFSILKRGVYGVYHHVSSQHLQRYLAEFDFRYNNRSALGIEDLQRTEAVLKGIQGKRLTYRRIDKATDHLAW
jgi:transposase-like protein